jgi:hypothetical protein
VLLSLSRSLSVEKVGSTVGVRRRNNLSLLWPAILQQRLKTGNRALTGVQAYSSYTVAGSTADKSTEH